MRFLETQTRRCFWISAIVAGASDLKVGTGTRLFICAIWWRPAATRRLGRKNAEFGLPHAVRTGRIAARARDARGFPLDGQEYASRSH